MNDIVERLRQMPSSFNDALRTMEEAAAEIERLRNELELARVQTVPVEMLQEIERLQDAKRRALALADEHAKQINRLKSAKRPLTS